MRILNTIIIVLFGVILGTPALQMLGHPLREPVLHGVVAETHRPTLRATAWWRGQFQEQFERWFGQRVGFRPWMVRTDNQIGISLFREVSARTADRVVLGREGVFYQQSGLTARNRMDLVPVAQLRELARQARTAQDLLAARGVAFVLVITPSKAEIYPENIPSSRCLPESTRRWSNYQSAVRLLREQGVNLIDAHALFVELKASTPYRLFPPQGIHWNLYSASLVTAQILDLLEGLIGKPLVHLACASVTLDSRPRADEFETDLADLINVWRPPRTPWQFPRARIEGGRVEGAYRPHLVIVGDSFSTAFPKVMAGPRVFKTLDFYYYFNTRTSFPGGRQTPVNKEDFDWQTEILAKDAVIVEVNETLIAETGFGFIQAAVKALPKVRSSDDPTPSQAPATRLHVPP